MYIIVPINANFFNCFFVVVIFKLPFAFCLKKYLLKDKVKALKRAFINGNGVRWAIVIVRYIKPNIGIRRGRLKDVCPYRSNGFHSICATTIEVLLFIVYHIIVKCTQKQCLLDTEQQFVNLGHQGFPFYALQFFF